MRNIRLLIIISFFFIIKCSFSQWAVYPGQTQLNPYLVNPAAISNTENLEMMLGYTHYKSYIDNNFNFNLMANARYSPNETGSSFMLGYDKGYEHDYYNSEEIRLGYAYRYGIEANKHITAGVNLSYYDFKYDFQVYDIAGTDYQRIIGDEFKVTPGVLIKWNRFSISASSRFHISRTVIFDYDFQADKKKVDAPFWEEENISIAYKFSITPSIKLKPYIRYFASRNYSLNPSLQSFWDYEYGCGFHFRENFESGLGFTKHSFYLFSRYQFNKLYNVAAMVNYEDYNPFPIRLYCQLGIRF